MGEGSKLASYLIPELEILITTRKLYFPLRPLRSLRSLRSITSQVCIAKTPTAGVAPLLLTFKLFNNRSRWGALLAHRLRPDRKKNARGQECKR